MFSMLVKLANFITPTHLKGYYRLITWFVQQLPPQEWLKNITELIQVGIGLVISCRALELLVTDPICEYEKIFFKKKKRYIYIIYSWQSPRPTIDEVQARNLFSKFWSSNYKLSGYVQKRDPSDALQELFSTLQ